MYGYQGEKRCNDDTRKDGTCLQTNGVGAGAQREKVDVRLGWSAPGGNWGVALVVNNALNKQYVSISTLGSAVGSPYAYITKPRVIALELRGRL
jgi:iron complex outermembrane receptor protein